MTDLTPAQRDVVTTTDRPLLVEAGPGSGKTLTLVEKFLHLTATGVRFDRILALTFSTKAAAEMRRRIEEATRRSYGRLWVSTFHSFGHELLRRFAPEAGVPRSFRILTGFKEWVLVRDVLAALPEENQLSRASELRGLVGEVANALALLKQNLLVPDALEQLAANGPTPALFEDLAHAARAYEIELRARRHLDYRDLVSIPLGLLRKDETVRARVRGWFDAVIIDELQDVDLAQVELVGALVEGSELARHVTGCGDGNQSIYGFRGAVPAEALSRLGAILQGVEGRKLDRNFRAAAPLQALGARLLGRPLPEEEPEAHPRIESFVAATGLAEATAIARAIRSARGTPTREGSPLRWRDVAILVRSIRRDGKAIESELDRLGVPYRVHGNASFYRNPAVAFLVHYLLALADETDDRSLRRVLASPVPGLPELPVARFLDRVSRRGRHAGRYLWFLRFLMEREDAHRFRVWRPDKADSEESERELEAERRVNADVRAPYFYDLMSLDEKQAFYVFHERFLVLRARARRAKEALPTLVATIAARSGLTDWILRVERTQPREAARLAANLSKLHSMIEEYVEIASASGRAPTLGDLASHLRELLDHFANESEVDAPSEDLDEPEDAVNVMTVHQAKGLEFELVFVPALASGHFPAPPRATGILPDDAVRAIRRARPFHDSRALDPLAHLDEERRLFYVAVTRARERIVLSWARRYAADEDDAVPSPFLVEALGSTERAFLDALTETEEPSAAIVQRLATASRWPRVAFRDDESSADDLDQASNQEELEIALRRLYQSADEPTRALLDGILARASRLDRTFIASRDPFPEEPSQPILLPRGRITLSASRLTEYEACPRKFFYSKLLHLEPISNQAAHLGTAVHQALESFHQRHSCREALREPERRAAAEAELRELLVEEIRAGRERMPSEFAYRRAVAEARSFVAPYLESWFEEPLPYVASTELELTFDVDGIPVLAKIDRVSADAPTIEQATEVEIADYKTVREANPNGIYQRDQIVKGNELQLVVYARAFEAVHQRPPSYLGKIYLKHRSGWRSGTLHVVLKVTADEPPRGDHYRGRDGRKQVDRAWIAPEQLDEAWAAIRQTLLRIHDPERSRFPITPSQAACRHCSFDTICGKEEARAADE